MIAESPDFSRGEYVNKAADEWLISQSAISQQLQVAKKKFSIGYFHHFNKDELIKTVAQFNEKLIQSLPTLKNTPKFGRHVLKAIISKKSPQSIDLRGKFLFERKNFIR
ncbi:MAG: hypothetical protein IJS81_08965 [Selenomonadaceae bacterium]|nr:hypothetical protein [Selenomonadaceae bacterium]